MNTTEQLILNYLNEPMPQGKEPKKRLSPEAEQALLDYLNEPMSTNV